MRLLPDFTLNSPVAAQFVPSDRFFMRFVPLVPDLPVLAQVELVLEGLAPFPPTQLYWGCWVAPDRASALVYAAHRRRFTPEELAGWERAELVLPDLIPLIGRMPDRPALVIQAGETHLVGAAWPGQTPDPTAVHARAYAGPPTEQERGQFSAELAARAKVDAPVTFVTGTPRARREGGQLMFELVDGAGAVIAATAVALDDRDALDVRDRAFLDKRRRDRRRGEFIWKVLLAGGLAAGLALLLDLGTVGLRLFDRIQQARLAEQAPIVARLETAHGLTTRIDELSLRRLRFFEMLSAINESRPGSIQFVRTGSTGRTGLEIEAQTSNATDVGIYENALQQLAALEKVEVRDLRARDGVTTFGLTVAFKADPAASNGGTP